VAEDWSRADEWAGADFLVTYTCDVRPTAEQAESLARFVEAGGRWFALHGTNSALEVGRQVTCPRLEPRFAETLGSQFLAHPPIMPYRVTVADPAHPLVKGIEPFEVNDELYLSELHGESTVLLETRFTGKAAGFERGDWPDDAPRPVYYLHPAGHGAVLYLTLGHCRGHYDMRPILDYYPVIERGSWELPVYHELLRRGLAWAKREAI
jgi:type 1 glutamine amidotransferase